MIIWITYVYEGLAELYVFFSMIFIGGGEFFLRTPPLFLVGDIREGDVVHD